jgi:hypothetical protein
VDIPPLLSPPLLALACAIAMAMPYPAPARISKQSTQRKTLAPAVAESSTANAKHHHGRGVRDNIGGLLVRHVDCRALHDDVVGLWVVAATRRCHRQELAAFVVGKRNVVAQATPFDRLREDELFAARQARDGVLRKLARHTTLEIDVHQLFPRFFVFFFSSFFSFLLARCRLD